MCLSAVYEVSEGAERLVCERAATVSAGDGLITLTDIMGKELVLSGALRSIDLVKNIIKIDRG